jgi:hypothetical protein|tara:strand:- start:2885 stop:3088 length:204 start_codon:yes stop_codon:yes gene_type:complete
MKYITHIKDAFFVLIIVYLSVTVTENVLMLKQLRSQLEQTKENLYQTNIVIEQMQKKLKESLIHHSF